MTDEEASELSYLRALLNAQQMEIEILKEKLLNREAKETIKEMKNHDIQKH